MLCSIFISAAVALAVFVVLGPILRINLAHLFAIFTFFLNYIPNVGPIVATLMPLPVAILDPNNSDQARHTHRHHTCPRIQYLLGTST